MHWAVEKNLNIQEIVKYSIQMKTKSNSIYNKYFGIILVTEIRQQD